MQGNSILATEVSFQNDINETLTADNAFLGVLEQLAGLPKYAAFARDALKFYKEILTGDTSGMPSATLGLTQDARFILCASEDPDSLYAWRTYAQDGIGCAIGLEKSSPIGVVVASESHHRLRHWRPVVYTPSEIREAARRELEELGDAWLEKRGAEPTSHSLSDALNVIILQLEIARSNVKAVAKDHAFKDEQEHRITVETPSIGAVETLPSKMGPRPHIRLVASANGKWGTRVDAAELAPKLPIRAIRLGPSAPDIATSATQWLLHANGYPLDPVIMDTSSEPSAPFRYECEKTVLIDKSSHPYRAR